MSSATLTGRRILVVDDEILLAIMVEDMLEEIGCAVAAVVATPDEAISAIEANEIDAAILDVNLNGCTSFGIAARLAEKDIPFLFATGYGPKGIQGEFSGRPVLTKPFRLSELEQVLKTIFDGGEG